MSKTKRTVNILPRSNRSVKTATDTGASVQPKPVRTLPENVPALFSDGLMVQHVDETFVLSFLKTKHPLALPGEQAPTKEMEQRCVAQIIVTPMQMARNLNVMNKNFKKFLLKLDPDTRKLVNDVAQLPLTDKEKEVKANA